MSKDMVKNLFISYGDDKKPQVRKKYSSVIWMQLYRQEDEYEKFFSLKMK